MSDAALTALSKTLRAVLDAETARGNTIASADADDTLVEVVLENPLVIDELTLPDDVELFALAADDESDAVVGLMCQSTGHVLCGPDPGDVDDDAPHRGAAIPTLPTPSEQVDAKEHNRRLSTKLPLAFEWDARDPVVVTKLKERTRKGFRFTRTESLEGAASLVLWLEIAGRDDDARVIARHLAAARFEGDFERWAPTELALSWRVVVDDDDSARTALHAVPLDPERQEGALVALLEDEAGLQPRGPQGRDALLGLYREHTVLAAYGIDDDTNRAARDALKVRLTAFLK